MLRIDDEVPGDVGAREALLDRAFGPARFAKTSERLREGRLPVLALSARCDGALVGPLRLWAVADASGRRLLLLGPLAESGRASWRDRVCQYGLNPGGAVTLK